MGDTFRLTRKIGFGLRPEEEIPNDVVEWAKAQLSSVPEPLGIARATLRGETKTDHPVEPWPAKYLLSLEQLVANAVAMKAAQNEADRKLSSDGEAWAAFMDKAREKSYSLNWDALRRSHQPVYSRQPVFERFSWFWANHFTVGANNQADRVFAHYFDFAISANLVRDFASLLYDVTCHPAMQVYLDGPYSIGPNSRLGKQLRAKRIHADINENLARELMELHSLGAEAGYTQADVVGVAKILTGHAYTIELPYDGKGSERWKIFRPDWHEPGEKLVLGQVFPEGKDALRKLTDLLAGHPSTISHISRKLAKHFIAEDPTVEDVAFIVDRWTTSKGRLQDIHGAVIERAVARAADRKFQPPEIWLYQMLRTSGANLFNGWEQTGSAQDEWMWDALPRSPRVLLEELGQSYWVNRQPNGYSDDRGDWISPEQMDRRLRYSALAYLAGFPALEADDLLERMSANEKTRTLASQGADGQEKFVLLYCSPEMMEA